MRRTRVLLLAATCLLGSLPALAASPWDGSWKLDLTRSKLAGETYTYTSLPENHLQWSNGADQKVDFPTDGREAPGPFPGTIVTWKPTGASAADVTFTLNGKLTTRQHLTLSPDGKTLTTESTSYRPDGTTSMNKTVATRTAGSTGFVGTWQVSDRKLGSPDVVELSSPEPDTLKMVVPAWKDSWQGKLDGTDAPFQGPDDIRGMTMSLKQTSDHSFDGVTSFNGKPISYEQDTLSADGKTWTTITWDAGKEQEKTTYVYSRQ